MTGFLTTARKAFAAFIAAGAGAFATAASDGDFTSKEGWIVAGVAVGAAGLVYSVPNQGA